MKKLPFLNVSHTSLFRMLLAQIRSKLLLTGIGLKIFDQLSEPKSASQVAETLETHLKNTKLFLDALAAIDLIQKKKGLYRNSPITQAFLVESSPTYLGTVLQMTGSHYSLGNLSKLVKEGPLSLPETNLFSRETLKEYVAMLASTELAGDAQMVVEIVSKIPGFPSFQRMLDLGGGPGLIGMAIVDSHPKMKGIIFDQQPIVEEAKKYIKEYEMEKRMEVLGGDFNRDPIGKGYDLVLACNSLQFAEDIEQVVKKVYNALNQDGVFVSIFPYGHTNERTKPETIVLNCLPYALMGHETGFEQGFIAHSMLLVGFKSVHSRKLATPWGPLELDIGRK